MQINMDLDGVSLETVIEMVSRQVGKTLEVDPKLAQRPVTATLTEISWRDAMKTLADAVGGKLEDLPYGGLRVVPR